MVDDAFFNRMKGYEAVSQPVLMRRTPVIVRVDGKNFSKLTHGMNKPFDDRMTICMKSVARRLAADAQNCRIAYHQSDEVSLLLTDFRTLNSEPWFANQIQKICSVAAATATAAFAREFMVQFPEKAREGQLPVFDARCFNLPREEVSNYFIWRQRDCERNSVSMAAQAHFSHKELQSMNRTQMLDMLVLRKGVNWNDYDAGFKRGNVVIKEKLNDNVMNSVVRSTWAVNDAPIFSQNRDFIERFLRDEEDRTESM